MTRITKSVFGWFAALVLVANCTSGVTAPTPPAGGTLVSATQGGSIVADGGAFRVDIPARALSKDTTLSVVPLEAEQIPGQVTANHPLGAVYSVRPDGLQLARPALITVTLKKSELILERGKPFRVPTLNSFAGGRTEVLAGGRTEFDARAGSAVFSGTTTHFSDFEVDTSLALTVTVGPGVLERSVLDPPWEATLTFDNAGKQELVVGNVVYEAQAPVVRTGVPQHRLLTLPAGGRADVSDQPPEFACLHTGQGWYSLGFGLGLGTVALVFIFKIGATCRLEMSPITATFARPVTTYSVSVEGDPDGSRMHYIWSKAGSPCGQFKALANGASWAHPDEDLGGNCPTEPVHPANIQVTASDDHGNSISALYPAGSAPGTGPPAQP